MLSVSNLCKAYSGESALSDVSFNLQRGEIVALLGANGSGKTTTVQSICRLIEWDSGEISLDGKPTRSSTSFLKKIGAVLGGCRNTNWRLSAKQNADYFARLRGFSGASVREKINEIHTALGLDEHSKKEVMKLSTGNKQKAALLCALAYSPDFVLLDEPTLGLDFQTVNDLQNIMKCYAKEQNQGFLVTSHDLGFIESICDRVVVLDKGRLLFEGNIGQLKARLFNYQLLVEVSSEASRIIEESAVKPHWQGHFNINSHENCITVNYEKSNQSLVFMHYLHEQNIHIKELRIEPLSIEKAYQTLVQSKDL
jgi:ABC-2 type transport system ATP-binding protein